jgi:pimeloyl-ACP methyl ester carboxylesterase
MPYLAVKGITLYYEIHGNGDPVLFIQGLRNPCEMWFAQLPFFTKEFKTIIFDNRGAGRSEKPDEEYSIRQMAEDSIGLLDHMAISSARVVGVSMGGLIAQEMAIEFPKRIRKLVLLSTHYGTGYWEVTQSLWERLLSVSTRTIEEVIDENLRLAFTQEFYLKHWKIINRIVKILCVNPQPAYAFMRQFEAAKKFDAKERVWKISAPTLVLSGTEDQIVPIELARRLAKQIPNSRFYEIKRASHLAFIEKADEVNQRILYFLRQ